MTLRLTPARLIAAYEYLKTTAPFDRLKLPDADDLEFRVTRHVDRHGHFDDRDGKAPYNNISVSERFIKTTQSLMELMAHEMAHVALHVASDPHWYNHGRSFKALARRICRAHGFDLATF